MGMTDSSQILMSVLQTELESLRALLGS